jgi:hypothetical protein
MVDTSCETAEVIIDRSGSLREDLHALNEQMKEIFMASVLGRLCNLEMKVIWPPKVFPTKVVFYVKLSTFNPRTRP